MAPNVVQFCPDDTPSSGVNRFCTELNAALVGQGVASVVARTVPEVLAHASEPSLVLHLHGLWLRTHHQLAVWARRAGVPVVWSTHGMTAPWSRRHKRWKKLPAWWLYQRNDLRRAAVLHVTSEQEAMWNADLGLRPRRADGTPSETVLAPLGAHLPSAAEVGRTFVSDAPQQPFTVLFVGRIHPVKGLVNLVRAAARLPQAAFRFRLVGPDQAGHRAELEAECRRSGVTNVVFSGELHGDDLARAYAACDVLALPSFTENSGGVVVDARAWGKPVIASTGTPWSCLGGKPGERMGWWVDNAPESLARALADAAGLPRGELAEMGRRGRRLVEEGYSWPSVARRLSEVYARQASVRQTAP